MSNTATDHHMLMSASKTDISTSSEVVQYRLYKNLTYTSGALSQMLRDNGHIMYMQSKLYFNRTFISEHILKWC